MKIATIIQARMGSTRLPGKVLRDLAGEPMLVRVVERAQRSTLVDQVIVATSDNLQDNAIVSLCNERGWASYAGSHDDVLDRYYQAATNYDADVVLRITADCPLIAPEIIDLCVKSFVELKAADYVSCVVSPRTFPRGLDTEVFSYSALQRAWKAAKEPACREHVTQYFHANPQNFQVSGVYADADYSGFRWTVDTPDDFALVQKIYQHFGHDRFNWKDVIEAHKTHPDWLTLNAHIEQKVA